MVRHTAGVGEHEGSGEVTAWVPVLPSADLGPGAVVAVGAWEREYVVWRGADGTAAVMPRACPHLDHDLAEATVRGDVLVCPGHEWCFDPAGRAGKWNVKGRFDRKDDVALPALREAGGWIELGVRAAATAPASATAQGGPASGAVR